MLVSSVETMVAGGGHIQEYGILPPVFQDDVPHIPALFLGPGFDPAIADRVEALASRHITMLSVPCEGIQVTDRRIILGDALGTLLLESPLTLMSSIALRPEGAADIFDQIEQDGLLREFPHYVLPQSCKRKLHLPAAVCKLLSVNYVPDAPPGCDADTLLKQYTAVGQVLSAYERKVYKHSYERRGAPSMLLGKATQQV